MTEPMIRLDRVTKTFLEGHEPAVRELTLDIPEGEIVVLVGPSGCGKTTTLKMINRLVEPTAGTIIVAGRDIRSQPPPELRRGIGYVIQQIGLLPHRTVAENIATVPGLLGWERSRIQERVHELIETMGLEASMLSRYPSELSGGQRQRVGVARALAADPPVLLMDEPFGAVDPIARGRLQQMLLHVQEQLKKTIVLVTHDINEAILLGDRIALLNVGGVLEQYAPPADLLAEPANPFVVDFLGEERGLKRLSLVRVDSLAVPRGPVVDVSAPREEAREMMIDHQVDWVGLVDGDKLLGWAWAEEIEEVDALRRLDPHDFRATLDCRASLREAIDAIVTTHNQVAVVLDGARYVGMLFVEQIAQELRA